VEEKFVYKYKGKVFSTFTNIPITAEDIMEFNEIAFNYFDNIKKTEEIRVVVLETWMLVEYYIRLGLSYTYNINKYKTERLNPKYDLLPNSFQVCLEKLNLLLTSQRSLPLPPTRKEELALSNGLWKYMKEKYPHICEDLLKITDEYNAKKFPELYNEIDSSIFAVKRYYGPYQDVKVTSMFENITEDWFKKAVKLNRARNVAAHSYDSEKIYKELGVSGSNRFEICRQYCIKLIEELCFITECDLDANIDIDMDE